MAARSRRRSSSSASSGHAMGASGHRRHGDGAPATDINTSWGSGYGVRLLNRLVADHYESQEVSRSGGARACDRNFVLPPAGLPLLKRAAAAGREIDRRGWRVVVQAGSEERVSALDAHLWTWRDDFFLPHGTWRDEDAGEQPVVLVQARGRQSERRARSASSSTVHRCRRIRSLRTDRSAIRWQ